MRPGCQNRGPHGSRCRARARLLTMRVWWKAELRAAKRLTDALFRFWRVGIGGELRLVLKGPGQHGQQLLERRIVVGPDRRLDDRLDAVVARDEGRIDAAHRGP